MRFKRRGSAGRFKPRSRRPMRRGRRSKGRRRGASYRRPYQVIGRRL